MHGWAMGMRLKGEKEKIRSHAHTKERKKENCWMEVLLADKKRAFCFFIIFSHLSCKKRLVRAQDLLYDKDRKRANDTPYITLHIPSRHVRDTKGTQRANQRKECPRAETDVND